MPHLKVDAHADQHIAHDPSLGDVLGFVLSAWFSPPSDQQQHGDRVHLGVDERQQGVDGVAQPAVLHVDARQLARPQVVPGGQGNGRTLVGGDDVLIFGRSVGDVVAKVLSPVISVEAHRKQLTYKFFKKFHETRSIITLRRESGTPAKKSTSFFSSSW